MIQDEDDDWGWRTVWPSGSIEFELIDADSRDAWDYYRQTSVWPTMDRLRRLALMNMIPQSQLSVCGDPCVGLIPCGWHLWTSGDSDCYEFFRDFELLFAIWGGCLCTSWGEGGDPPKTSKNLQAMSNQTNNRWRAHNLERSLLKLKNNSRFNRMRSYQSHDTYKMENQPKRANCDSATSKQPP